MNPCVGDLVSVLVSLLLPDAMASTRVRKAADPKLATLTFSALPRDASLGVVVKDVKRYGKPVEAFVDCDTFSGHW